MANLVVLAFDQEYTAEQAKARLLELQDQRLIILDDLVVVIRHSDGKSEIRQAKSVAKGAALGGAFWGMLIGLLFLSPILGAAIGAGIGAVVGHYHDLGVDEKFMKEVGSALRPGTSGVFLLISQATPDRVIEQMKEFHPTVIRTNLSTEQEARLRAAFSPEGEERTVQQTQS